MRSEARARVPPWWLPERGRSEARWPAAPPSHGSRRYRAAGLVWRTELEGPIEASLRGIGFWMKQQVADFDEQQAALADEDGEGGAAAVLQRPAGMWLVLTVQLR